jgi:hypothetical protein
VQGDGIEIEKKNSREPTMFKKKPKTLDLTAADLELFRASKTDNLQQAQQGKSTISIQIAI